MVAFLATVDKVQAIDAYKATSIISLTSYQFVQLHYGYH